MGTAHPIMPRGIMLYLKGPKIVAYANTVGIVFDCRRRFSVISAWGRRCPH